MILCILPFLFSEKKRSPAQVKKFPLEISVERMENFFEWICADQDVVRDI